MRPGPLHDREHDRGRTDPDVGRRWLLRAVPAAAMLAVAGRARAAASVTDLVLACDITLGPAMRAASTAYANTAGVRVDVFPTQQYLILPQLEREVQNDIVVTRVATLDAAVKAGVVAPDAIRGAWRNRLVVAAKRGATTMSDRPIAFAARLSASGIDSRTILAQLQLLDGPVLGVVDTDTVVALVANGTARAGLLHMTDVRAHPALEVIREVPDDIEPPIAYAAAVTKLSSRPDPAGLIDFLVSSQGTTLLATLGLESPTAS